MITQSAINTEPPIKLIITSIDWRGRKNGNIRVGNHVKFAFTGLQNDIPENIEEIVRHAYNQGYSEASTYFLNKYNQEIREGIIKRLEKE